MSIEKLRKELSNIRNAQTKKGPISEQQLKARTQLSEARESEKKRKLETRIKIFIGGYFLAKSSESDLEDILNSVSKTLDPKNKNALEKWRRKTKC